MLIVGGVEEVVLEPQGVAMKARIDTGAKTSSIDAQKMVPFERDGKNWVRFNVPLRGQEKTVEVETPVTGRIQIKRHGEKPLERLVVTLRMVLGPLDQKREFTLADRAGYDYAVLIGRNFLRGSAIVDVDRELTLTPTASKL